MKSYAPSAVARGFALGVLGGGLGVLGAVRVIKEIIVFVRDGFFADEESATTDARSSAGTPSTPSSVGSVESSRDDIASSASDVDDDFACDAMEEAWRTTTTTTRKRRRRRRRRRLRDADDADADETFAKIAFRGLQCAAWTFVLGPVVQSVLTEPPESRF